MIRLHLDRIARYLSLHKLARETAWSIAAKVVGFTFYFALLFYLPRELGASGYGIWSLFMSIFLLVRNISNLGVNESVKNKAPNYQKMEELSRFVHAAILTRLYTTFAVGTVLFLLIVIYRERAVDLIGKPQVIELLIYSFPLLFLYHFSMLFKNLYQGLHSIKYVFYISLTEQSLKFLLVVLIPVAGLLGNVLLAFTAAITVTVALAFALTIRGGYLSWSLVHPVNLVDYEDRSTLIQEISEYGFPLLLISIGFIVLTEIDVVMLGMLTDSKSVGNYALAKRIISKLPHLSIAIAMGTMPVFADINSDVIGQRRRTLWKVLIINTVLFTTISAAIIVLIPEVIPIVFGEEFRRAILPTQILTAYATLLSFNVYFSRILDYQGLATQRAMFVLITIVLGVVLNYIFIPRHGPAGAAVATCLAYIPYTLLTGFKVKQLLYDYEE